MQEILLPSFANEQHKIDENEKSKSANEKEISRKEIYITWILHQIPVIGEGILSGSTSGSAESFPR